MKCFDGWELDEGSFESLRKVFLGTKEVGGRRKLKKKIQREDFSKGKEKKMVEIMKKEVFGTV